MPPSKKRITHRDVAQRAGVSNAVVSYVINGGPRPTSPEVRERVLKAIQELDYHPSAFARALSVQRTNTIAVIDKDYYQQTVFSTSYTTPILTGMAARLKIQGYYLLMYPMQLDEDLRTIELLLRSGRVDGIVIRSVDETAATNELLALVRATSIPCVCIEAPGAPQFGLSTVSYDNASGAYQATRYLLKQGHRRIAHIAGDQRYMTARHRVDGYLRALAEYQVDSSLIVGGDWSASTAQASVVQLVAMAEPPTAIVAASDRLAIAALAELRNRQYRVPEDIAIIGFDDGEIAQLAVPPLTTVHVPLYEIGQRVAERILALIQTPHEHTNHVEVLPVELVYRRSA